MDRQTHHCMAQPLPSSRQGLGRSQPQCLRVLNTCLHTHHAAKALQPLIKCWNKLYGLLPFGLRSKLNIPFLVAFLAIDRAENNLFCNRHGIVANAPHFTIVITFAMSRALTRDRYRSVFCASAIRQSKGSPCQQFCECATPRRHISLTCPHISQIVGTPGWLYHEDVGTPDCHVSRCHRDLL
jgi:hypothetical protein